MNTIEVLDPRSEARFGECDMTHRPTSLEGKVLGFMSNAKPNGDILLKDLERLLKDKLHPSTAIMREKPAPALGAPTEVIEELCARCDFVILAVGD